ncbi:NAD(P)/FAD-dependent oxidoreductase [Rhodococcus sp. IEGM 1366]|uniref:flavin-containing monooxygenase n=1 Tax=Rhodococcus sp. IEGM 1366 TaxID=3082223 RepID=UPI002953BA82|nr:NAD(P)/FAD-dependent oxidoreductase [Rhodococcus sp. IEGM 1366]
MALYQATGDHEIAEIPLEQQTIRGGQATKLTIAEPHLSVLRDKAVRFLLRDAGDLELRVPTDAELDGLIEMAESHPVDERLLRMRRTLLSFEELPHCARWNGERPELPEGFEVLVIGGGFGGVAMGVQLGQLGIPFVLLERRHEIGGVWSINKYPDVRVDTLTATYQFSFEKCYPWTEYFARQHEVRSYLEHVARKYGVLEHTRFGQDVVSARFDEDSSSWHVRVRSDDGTERDIKAAIVVSAVGLFANSRKLNFDGVEDFDGEVLHTTEWGPQHTAEGKRVAVIGNGSTGVQLLGKVAKSADHVDVYQRTPQWISPREKYGDPLTDEAAWLLEAMPYYWNWSRYVAVMPLFDAREMYLTDPEWVAQGGQINERTDKVRDGLVAYIKEQVGDRPDLIAKLIPDYAPMARRPVVDNKWYEALTRDNVDLVTEPIVRFTENGILTDDGVEHPIDLVIAAIGFDAHKYLWPVDYRGRSGVGLHERWAEAGAQAYLGMTVPDFPNLFMLYGPNSQPISGGATLPTWFEIWASYIAKLLIPMIEQGLSEVEVREDVYDAYNQRLQETAAELVIITDERSREKNYYVNEFGRMQVNAPWEAEDYYAWTITPELDDFLITKGKAHHPR